MMTLLDRDAAGAMLTIDLGAIVANYNKMCRQAGSGESAAVVKADAYGLGAIPIVSALANVGCRAFFVAHAEEGVAIRPAAPNATIFVLHGFTAQTAKMIRNANLVPVLSSTEQVSALRNSTPEMPFALQFDTGMSRLGLEPIHAAHLATLGQNPVLVMSHLACGDEPGHPLNDKQLAAFQQIRARFPATPASLAASGGAFLGAEYAFDLIRPGIGLYGGAPQLNSANPMQATVTLTAPILQVREIDTGTSAGYGATYSASRPRRLATVGLGYADGIIRAASNRGFAIVDGVKCVFAGRVSMDLVTLDVSDCPRGDPKPGTSAVFLSGEITIDQAAAAASTVAYEVLTRLGPRISRRYIGA